MANRALITSFFFISLFSFKTHGASCCGGGAGLPNIITGDHKAKLTLSASSSTVTYDVSNAREIEKRDGDNIQLTETVNIKTSALITELWQFGLTLPIKKNTHTSNGIKESTTGIGDLGLQLAYEFMPEYSYSPWKPRGFLYLRHDFPISRSAYDSNKPLRSDSLGRGYQQTGLGLSFFKNFIGMSLTTNFEFYQGHEKEFNQEIIIPGRGQISSLALSFTPKSSKFSYTTGALYLFENASKTRGDINSDGSSKEYAELLLNIGYTFEQSSISFSYNDQSFFPIARNTTLNQAIALSYTSLFNL